VLAGVSRDDLATAETLDAVAELDDLAAEFVTENALSLDAGEWVWRFHRYEHGTCDILMQV